MTKCRGILLAARALAVGLAFVTLGAPVAAEEANGNPAKAEVDRLRAYGDDLLRQLEAMRADLAASEKARKETEELLRSMTQRLREQLAEKQSNYAKETVRREKEVTTTRQELDSAKAEEARQAARAAELEKNVGALRDTLARGDAERKKLEGEVAASERAREEAARTHGPALAE